jgi:Protein of unknown function (DUF3108)
MNPTRLSRRCLPVVALALGVTMLAGHSSQGDPAESRPTKVKANYGINFNGLNIGDFKLSATLANGEYTVNADAQISVLAGMLFAWNGTTSSSGRVISRGPLPYAYSFGYKTSEKSEKIDIKFSNNVVREIAVTPPQRPSPSRVPLTRKHMQNVIDPLSAVVMLTNVGANKTGPEVCAKRLPIFDGKARYDLQLSYKATKSINATGYKGPAYVCKVKFIPIAGHKPGDDESVYAAKNEGMEVWMMPVTKAALYIPYYIYVPTPVGTATLTSSDLNVDVSGDSRRALIQ